MDRWTLHWLEASGSLEEFRPELLENFKAAYRSLSHVLLPPVLDILMQRLAGETILELGVVGRAYRETMFALTVDPGNTNFASSLRNGALHRQIIHEVHHCLRMAGPGYGWTLGEALVSEGLAGQFVKHLIGAEAEPWERAVSIDDLRADPPDAGLLDSTRYDHDAWFFGSGGQPRWLGYTLGYEMVGRWLANIGQIDVSARIRVPAGEVIAIAFEEGLVR